MNRHELIATSDEIRDKFNTALSPFMHAALKKIHGVNQYVEPENNRRAELRAQTKKDVPFNLKPRQDKNPSYLSTICTTLFYWDECFREVFLIPDITFKAEQDLRHWVDQTRDLRNTIIG